MPLKNSDKEERTPAVTLRRSPRFLQIVLAEAEDPKTPKPEQQRSTRVPSSATPLSLTGKRNVSSRRRSHRSKSKECSQKLDESCNARQSSDNSKTKSRRSTRLNRCAEMCNAVKLPHNSNRRYGELERRVTRSSCCRDLNRNAEKADYGGFSGNTSHGCSSGKWITGEGVNIPKQMKSKSLKNKVKRCDNNPDQFDTLLYDDSKTSERVLPITENKLLDEELSQKHVDKITNGISVTNAVVVNKMQKNIGVKRLRNQFENIVGTAQGWTKDQESALERAYLEAKPTPHFWKKVSKLVPGKSAQECFDKIHGNHLTPPQPQIRSRARLSNSQNQSFSASKLLNTSSPTTKRPKYRKQKSHIIQRTVRHMLQNQYKMEQNSESDMFSILEPTFSPSLNLNLVLTTPDRDQETNEVVKRCSTVHKKSVSRFCSSNGTTIVSPPVLKQVKNKALHEKYIDLLNCREANRKAASVKAEKVNKSKVMKQESSAERKNAIKAAKNALVFGAKDAISEFQHQQATVFSNLFDCESGADDDEDDD